VTKHLIRFVLVGVVVPFICVRGDAAPVATPATTPSTSPAVDDGEQGNPSDAVQKRGTRAAKFIELHNQFLDRIKNGPPIELLFIGDSITAGWNSRAKDIWDKYYGPSAANFGIGADRTQHVIWRITNGELDGIKPKVIVLMIGTNNTGRNSPEEIAAAVEKIITITRGKLPETKILLLGVFPRMKGYEKQGVKIDPINQLISKFDDGKMVRYLDIGDKFKNADGKVSEDIMPDGLHPSTAGYQIWADAMQPLLSEMMKN